MSVCVPFHQSNQKQLSIKYQSQEKSNKTLLSSNHIPYLFQNMPGDIVDKELLQLVLATLSRHHTT